MQITDVIMDFDGTCTMIPEIYEAFLSEYLAGLNNTVFSGNPIMAGEWKDAQEKVKMHSPRAAWTFAFAPAAPAAADPYILSFEAARYLLQKKNIQKDIPSEVFKSASDRFPAPWRPEAREVFETLLKNNINITFISNSSSTTITNRLLSLFSGKKLPFGITVKSDAAKFRIAELSWYSDIPKGTQDLFRAIPPTLKDVGTGRPVYLRRAAYFEAICAAFKNDLTRLPSTVVCGDIWEMDLALPYELGANIHLIERACPFDTYDYERKATLQDTRRGKISNDLRGLLKWV
jgi:phosphoglycolate phosphatase-like HAD superfamily hydrolase